MYLHKDKIKAEESAQSSKFIENERQNRIVDRRWSTWYAKLIDRASFANISRSVRYMG